VTFAPWPASSPDSASGRDATASNEPKPCLNRSKLRELATVGVDHYALVAYVEDDSHPIGIARLVRHGSSAEVAVEVVDRFQRRGIGSALIAELVSDACAAGVTELTALVSSGYGRVDAAPPHREEPARPLRGLGALDPRRNHQGQASRTPARRVLLCADCHAEVDAGSPLPIPSRIESRSSGPG
jgi:GNAT superfamily N-acetyltransferase